MISLKVKQCASNGITMGKAFVVKKEVIVADTYAITAKDIGKELSLYESAIKKVVDDLQELSKTSDVFAAHIELVQDINLVNAIKDLIKDEKNVQMAVQEACNGYEAIFRDMDDTYMCERAADIKDIKERLLYALKGKNPNPFSDMTEPAIVVAMELAPSDTVKMNSDFVLGFVTQLGGVTSHVAIIAKNLGLPALVGVTGLMDAIKNEEFLILAASENELIIDPNNQQIEEFRIKIEEKEKEKEKLKQLVNVLVKSKDGKVIELCANVGNLEDIKRAKEFGFDGIGLFRSEFLYMENTHFPTEEEQFLVYKEALELAQKEVTIRTLDIGGDKGLPYFDFEKEENPFLGWRAIRICLDRKDIFKTQLRALLRASIYGKLRIMYPMIISEEELDKANEVLSECKAELEVQGIEYDKNVKVGIMVETPAAVFSARELAKKADFFSIGTNDLTQYITAVDRGNEKVAHLYDSKNPAVLCAIRQIIEAGHREGIKVGMCGEFASDETVTSLLLEYGLDEFSMSASCINRIKAIILDI
ncbi:MAG: phosphoenolpyruvate-protein phosphotransferase [Lachnospiraceae bacterium]|jgi:phosphotransferase system enzyme I (PtsI)|nr:phosphoenolpyruvate-protein phosphotransferase [Lachnospiraceae bacterium]